jgi:hypothetical protein
MSECTCHKNYTEDVLIPQVGVITDIRQETPDVKTFRVNALEGGKLFEHMPGQCAMLCVPGVSEGMFSITSSPTNKEYQEFSIKKCGSLTETLHSLEVGDEITVRGPYGNHFPVEDKLKGKNLLFIAGGIGLAPLRSVINYVLDNRADYGTVDILYGSRSAAYAVKGLFCTFLQFSSLCISNILHDIKTLGTGFGTGITTNTAVDLRIKFHHHLLTRLQIIDIIGSFICREERNACHIHAFLYLRLTGQTGLQLILSLDSVNGCTGTTETVAAATSSL